MFGSAGFDAEDGELILKTNYVGFVPKNWQQEQFERTPLISEVVRVSATRYEMYKVTGKAMRYNLKFISGLSLPDLKTYLDTLHRVRMLKCSYGLFREEN